MATTSIMASLYAVHCFVSPKLVHNSHRRPTQTFEQDTTLLIQGTNKCFRFKEIKHGLCRLPSAFNEGRNAEDEKGISLDEDVFQQNFRPVSQNIDEKRPRDGLVPEDWKSLQQELNKSKKEKKREIRDALVRSRREKEITGRAVVDVSNGPYESLNRVVDSCDQYLEELQEIKKGGLSYGVVKRHSYSGNVNSLPERDDVLRAKPKSPWIGLEAQSLDNLSKRIEEFKPMIDEEEQISFSLETPDYEKKTPEQFKVKLTKEEKDSLKKRIPDFKNISSSKWLPLHTFSASGQTALLAEMLAHGADVNLTDKNGLTALHRAILNGKEGAAKYLIRAGGADVLVKDKDGANFLHHATQSANINLVKLMLKQGMDINSPDNEGWTPLHIAVQSQRIDIIKTLLKRGADINARNKDGSSPLDMAFSFRKGFRTYEIVKILKREEQRNVDIGTDESAAAEEEIQSHN